MIEMRKARMGRVRDADTLREKRPPAASLFAQSAAEVHP
jgi:hypothetical protein